VNENYKWMKLNIEHKSYLALLRRLLYDFYIDNDRAPLVNLQGNRTELTRKTNSARPILCLTLKNSF